MIPTCTETFEGPQIDQEVSFTRYSVRLIADFFVQSFTEVATHLYHVDGTPLRWTQEDMRKVFEMCPQHRETIEKDNCCWYSLQSELLDTFETEQVRHWALSGVNLMALREHKDDNG